MYAPTAVVPQRVHLKILKEGDNSLVKKAYELYFGDQDKGWIPKICCTSCAVNLRAWITGSRPGRPSMPFAIPMTRRELKIMFQTVISF